MKKNIAVIIKPYLTALLYFLLLAFYANFIFKTGNYKTLFYICSIVAVVCFSLNYNRLLDLVRTKQVACFVMLSIIPLLLGALPFEDIQPTKRYLQNIVYFIVLCITIIFCLKSMTPKWREYSPAIIASLCILGMFFHLYGVIEVNALTGFYSNPHYLALFCVISLPAVSYPLLKNRTIFKTIAWIVAIGVIFYLLVNTSSRPAWGALLLGYGAGCGLLLRGNVRIIALACMVVVAILTYLLLPNLVGARVDELIINLAVEERVYIWGDTFRMQLASEPVSWIFGHGPGSFKANFEIFHTTQYFLYFPHHFFLEIMFESGIIGVLVISFLYFKLYSLLFFVFNNDYSKRLLMLTLFVCLTSHLIFTFFTVPFYSKYVILIQAPIVALILYYYDETRKRITN